MPFEEILERAKAEGAIRVRQMSPRWWIAYRRNPMGRRYPQARWIVESRVFPGEWSFHDDKWYETDRVPPEAVPVEALLTAEGTSDE